MVQSMNKGIKQSISKTGDIELLQPKKQEIISVKTLSVKLYGPFTRFFSEEDMVESSGKL